MSVHLIFLSRFIPLFTSSLFYKKTEIAFYIKKGSLQLGVKGNVAIWKRQNSFFMRVKGKQLEVALKLIKCQKIRIITFFNFDGYTSSTKHSW